MARDVAVLVGSLRRESFNRRMANAMIALAPKSLALEIVEFRDVPPFDQDDEKNPPAPSRTFKERIRRAEALLFVTPEYNRSVPGALKNAIDVASRPYGDSAWSGKPGAVMTVSPGAIGGFGANHHLRQMMVFLDVPMMAQPEAYVGGAAKLFGEDGSIVVDATREFVVKFLTAFERWIELLKAR